MGISLQFTLLQREAYYKEGKILTYTGREQRVTCPIPGTTEEHCWEKATHWLTNTSPAYQFTVKQVFPTERNDA